MADGNEGPSHAADRRGAGRRFRRNRRACRRGQAARRAGQAGSHRHQGDDQRGPTWWSHPTGKALSFGVSVSLKNAGHGAAPASTTTILVIQDGSPIARDKVRAGPLAPGHATTQIAIFRDVEAGLGFLHAEGVAEGRLHADAVIARPCDRAALARARDGRSIEDAGAGVRRQPGRHHRHELSPSSSCSLVWTPTRRASPTKASRRGGHQHDDQRCCATAPRRRQGLDEPKWGEDSGLFHLPRP